MFKVKLLFAMVLFSGVGGGVYAGEKNMLPDAEFVESKDGGGLPLNWDKFGKNQDAVYKLTGDLKSGEKLSVLDISNASEKANAIRSKDVPLSSGGGLFFSFLGKGEGGIETRILSSDWKGGALEKFSLDGNWRRYAMIVPAAKLEGKSKVFVMFNFKKANFSIANPFLGKLPQAYNDKKSGGELLENPGFILDAPGELFPTVGWAFNYNDKVSGKFVADKSFEGQQPVLELNNPEEDKAITIKSTDFSLDKAGKYVASVWLKVGENADGKKFSVTMRAIRSDWKKSCAGNPEQLQNGWLKYETVFNIPENQLSKYFFRMDIKGKGYFYVADPSFKPMGDGAGLKKKLEKN